MKIQMSDIVKIINLLLTGSLDVDPKKRKKFILVTWGDEWTAPQDGFEKTGCIRSNVTDKNELMSVIGSICEKAIRGDDLFKKSGSTCSPQSEVK